MDGTPLDKAYSSAKNADAALISGDFDKAAVLYEEAAQYFEQVRTQSPANKSARTLQALADQHRSRAEYCKSGKAASDAKKHLVTPSSSTSIASVNSNSNASVNATPAIAGSNRQPPPRGPNLADLNISSSQYVQAHPSGTPPSPGSVGIVGALSESVNSLMMRGTAVFARTFEQAIADKTTPNAMPPSPGNLTNIPSESFYLVKPQQPKDQKSLRSAASAAGAGAGGPQGTGPGINSSASNGQVILTSFERQQAISQATKAQRNAVKPGLQQILTEIASKEQQINDEHTEEVDRLRAENDRLKIQVSKLKSRWEDLKESARKRQSGDQ